ncbi:McrC family protein [Stieleria sp. TO1_6]|uniref:McrC family protein n=1 Tax=Stieleria tagensis TaxID=2956795 RepID=UPI00209B4709|nr:McrC family protein [Stieleria tagensis]MCO8122603.1 McrC family protein [Stieleria tagensis]
MNAVAEPTNGSPTTTDIVCDEKGTPGGRHWTGNLDKVRDDYAAIRRHAENRTIHVIERAGQIEIHALDRVGVLVLPSGRRIVLRTKIPGIVLLDWLAYLNEFPDIQIWGSGGNIQSSDSWQTALARLFLAELEVLTRCHLRKGFVPMQVDSPNVRGRILTNRLSQRMWRLPSIPQIVRGRSINTAANQVLAMALDKLVHFQSDLEAGEKCLFHQLRTDWSEVSREQLDQQSILQTSVAAPPDGYRPAIQLARLLLTGASLDPDRGVGGDTFTLSLSRIWELAVTRMCDDLASETGWQVAPRSTSIRRWDDSLGPDDPNRSLIADTLLRRGSDRWILDAKYKRGFGDESRSDRFQMCAYVLGFGANRATLVYPFANAGQPHRRTLMSTTFGGAAVTIDAIALPMNQRPAACKLMLARQLKANVN